MTDRPSFIALRTIIALAGAEQAEHRRLHGSEARRRRDPRPQGAPRLRPGADLRGRAEVLAHTRARRRPRRAAARAEWHERLRRLARGEPRARRPARPARRRASCPTAGTDALPVFPAGKAVATRAASGEVLTALAAVLPELWGGSADLAGSNNTTMKGEPSFIPAKRSTHEFAGDQYGRTLHFGIREHAHGRDPVRHRAARPDPRLRRHVPAVQPTTCAARCASPRSWACPATYVWTHDSIGLGEDGPTHQPVEHLAALRAIPGLDRRPPGRRQRDRRGVEGRSSSTPTGPVGLILTRQNVPTFPRGEDGFAVRRRRRPRRVRARSRRARGTPDVDPHRHRLRGAARRRGPRDARGRRASPTRVVSVPCLEWFAEQDEAYRESVLPPSVAARVSVEAGIALSLAQDRRRRRPHVSLEHFGASADYETLYREFGITAEAVVAAAHESIAAARGDAGAGRRRRDAHARAAPATSRLTRAPDPHGRPRTTDAGTAGRRGTTMAPQQHPLARLADAGVAVWLDDLSRERLRTGNLAELVASAASSA